MKLDQVETTNFGSAKQKMLNIPTNFLVVVDKKTDSKYCHVRQFITGTIQLNGFAIMQFLEGAELVVADATIITMKSKSVQLILRLAKSIPMVLHEEFVDINVDRKDLQNLRKWLELRMTHCEKERDERIVIPGTTQQKFNPDTYIGQKLLLLDLRELLMGEIIEE